MNLTQFGCLLAGSVLAAAVNATPEPEASTGFALRPIVEAQQGMVVTANPYASQAAQAVLQQDGSAIDAAIAAQMVLTLVEPQSSGIGGGLFLLNWDESQQQLSSLDGRETAPDAILSTHFVDEEGLAMPFWQAVIGGASVGVPGVVAALYDAHKRHGKIAWAALLQPAIELAENGFVVSPRLAALLDPAMNQGLLEAGSANDYFYPDGQPLQAGKLKKNPALAHSLSLIAKLGDTGFYQGELAQAITTTVQQESRRAGSLTLADLSNYQAQWREPLCTEYRSYQVCGMAPPSSGATTVGQILGLLEAYPIDQLTPSGITFSHLFGQASRIAYADRGMYLADPDFVMIPTAAMLDGDYLKKRRQAIRMATDLGRASAGQFLPGLASNIDLDFPSTTHLVVADNEGNLVSMTSSIEMGFGSSVMVGGFLLNNQLTDFSFIPEKKGVAIANRIEANKRPRSSMAPTIVLDSSGQPIYALGSPGGSRIISYVTQALVGLIDWQLPLEQIVTQRRISHRNDYLALEQGHWHDLEIKTLQQMGNDVRLIPLNSGLHIIEKTATGWRGAADPRREGVALGVGGQ